MLMPKGLAANSVSSFSDGTILATVLARRGMTYADFVRKKDTGGVYEWIPGKDGFHLLPGTELPGNNGLTTSPDDRRFYVVAYGLHAIYAYARNDTRIPLWHATAPGFMPDNVHWAGRRLITAGMVYDEPACGGTRKIVNGKADPMRCHRGYKVAYLDPKTRKFSLIAYAEPNPGFNGVTTAVIIGDELWLGSYQANCLAFRRLPGRALENKHSSDVVP